MLLSRRFGRQDGARIPFLSAMSMLGAADGERGSYPDLVDPLAAHGEQARADARALYRRMVFNVLVSNVDDRLRNHGFLWLGRSGWMFSPPYDLNPTPTDVKARILTTNIDLDEETCSLDLVESAAGFFGLGLSDARAVIREVGTAVATWREVAAQVGARPAEINRMRTALEHDELARAQAL